MLASLHCEMFDKRSFYQLHADTCAVRPPHLGHNSVHDEGFDGSDMALRVINGDEEVFDVGVLLLLLILLQSVLVDHGAGRVGHGTFICQGCVLDQ